MQLGLVDAAEPVQQNPHTGEERRLHPGMRQHVQRDTAEPLRGEHRETDEEQAGVRDGGIGQQPLQMALEPAHHRTEHRGQRTQGQQRPLRVGRRDAAGAREDRPVDPGDAVDAQLDHDPGHQHAHRCGRHRMRVGQPEVEGHRRGLDEQSGGDEDEGGDHQRVRAAGVRVQGAADLGEAEFAGAGVEQSDAEQRGVGTEGVDDAEHQGPLDGAGLLDAVAGQGVGDDAHQLEEDKGVEQIPGQREAAHTCLEEQHQGGKEPAWRRGGSSKYRQA